MQFSNTILNSNANLNSLLFKNSIKNPNKLKIGHINANRLISHFTLIEYKCSTTKYDVLVITETFLTELDMNSSIHIGGYNFFRVDRLGKHGGGVGIYVRDHFESSIIAQSEPQYDNSPEYIILNISFGNEKLLMAGIYARPKCAYPTNFFNLISSLFIVL